MGKKLIYSLVAIAILMFDVLTWDYDPNAIKTCAEVTVVGHHSDFDYHGEKIFIFKGYYCFVDENLFESNHCQFVDGNDEWMYKYKTYEDYINDNDSILERIVKTVPKNKKGQYVVFW